MAEKPVIDHVRVLMDEFNRSGIRTMHVRVGSFEVLLSQDQNAHSLNAAGGAPASAQPAAAVSAVTPAPLPAPVATAAPAASPAAIPAGAVVIAAPNLGTFYRAPKPGSAPYVEVGSMVAEGDEICLVEVMKLFTAVRAPQAGKIVAILADDAAMVEAGQPLFALMAD